MHSRPTGTKCCSDLHPAPTKFKFLDVIESINQWIRRDSDVVYSSRTERPSCLSIGLAVSLTVKLCPDLLQSCHNPDPASKIIGNQRLRPQLFSTIH